MHEKRPWEGLNEKNLARANRFEHHLARLIDEWKKDKLEPSYLDVEFERAEKSLKELGVGDENDKTAWQAWPP